MLLSGFVGSIGIPAWIGMVPVGAVTVFSGATALAYLALLIMVAHQLTRVNAAGDGVEVGGDVEEVESTDNP